MLYNINGNDPELYTTTERDMKNNILNKIKETTGITIENLLDNGEEIIKQIASGDYSAAVKTIKDTVKKSLTEDALYYLSVDPLDIK